MSIRDSAICVYYTITQRSVMNNIVITLSILFSASVWASDIKPVAFLGVKSGSSDYTTICNALEKYCNADNTTTIWKIKNKPAELYLITQLLNFVKVKRENDDYSVVQVWNFSHYPQNEEVFDDVGDLSMSEIEIFPALYPLSKTKNAIALVSHWGASYSGGFRTEDFANFIMLNDDGTYMTAFSDVPFYSRKMIRACFSEDEYSENAHCHDESWSVLNIAMEDKGSEFYSWQFINKSYVWPAFVDKSKMTMSVNRETVDPFQNTKKNTTD